MADDDSRSEASDDDNDEISQYEKPYIPKPWVNKKPQFTDATVKWIENYEPQKTRPLIQVKFIKRRQQFGQMHKLTETDASEKMTDIKPQQDPFNHQKNKVIEIGLDGNNQITASGAQTTWNRRINKIHGMDSTSTAAGSQSGEPVYEDDDSEILQFLEQCQLEVERGLQSNEVVDIYQNDFDMLNLEENTEGTPARDGVEVSNAPKESKSFLYNPCRGKQVTSIQFQPNPGVQRGRYIAVSYIQYIDNNDRVIYSMKSHKHYIVLWDYQETHSYDPVLILVCPIQITNFKFNPRDSNIIVAGAMNGQIFMWDLKVAFNSIVSKQNQQGKQEKSSDIPQIAPYIVSALQDPVGLIQSNTDIIQKNVPSHKNPVLSLAWFPPGIQLDKKQFYNTVQGQPEECNQFASLSCDGQVLIWDIRFFQTKESRQPQQQDISQVVWRAIYAIQLFRPEGGGMMGGTQMAFPRKNAQSPSFTATSDQGELFLVELLNRATEESSQGDMVTQIWNRERNYRPTVALDLSPHYEDIILTVHDFYFCVWKHQVDVPIFESSIIQGSQLTAGCFSPSRPAVIFIGRTDGKLEIWDFIDQSHKYAQIYPAGAYSISTIQFHDNPVHHHSVSVGDVEGFVHIIELPYTLYKKSGDQEKAMREFWKREVLRVEYFKKRFEFREEVFQKEKEQQEHAQALEQAKTAQKEGEEQKDIEEDKAIQEQYRLMADQYIRVFINKEPPQDEKKQKEDKQK